MATAQRSESRAENEALTTTHAPCSPLPPSQLEPCAAAPPPSILMPPMEDFSRDCLRIGCLRAFLHFSLTLRGREELVVTVRTQVSDFACSSGRKRASTL